MSECNRCPRRPLGARTAKEGSFRNRADAFGPLRRGSRPGQRLFAAAAEPSGLARHNPSLQPTCYGLRPPHAAELKRWAAQR